MYGALFGDIIGSYYESHCTKNYNFEMFRKDNSFTDDTVLNTAVCDAILYDDTPINKKNLKKRAYEYAIRYKAYYRRYSYAGFGVMFSEWAESDIMKKQKSYANGAAMRVIPIGYAYDSLEQVHLQVEASCLYTHKNREAITGAKAVSSAVFLAVHGKSKTHISEYIERNFRYNLNVSLSDIKENYVFDSSTSYSVPPAIIAFLESENYEDAVRKAVSLGGDADTMACIAGGIAEAFYQKIPEDIKRYCMSKLDMGIKEKANEFTKKYINFRKK